MIVNVQVVLRLSDHPAIETDLEFCFAIVWCIAGMYFKGLWSKFMINDWGISYFSTIVTMLWGYNNSASFLAPSGISTLPVVRIRFWSPFSETSFVPNVKSPCRCDSNYNGDFVQLKPLWQIWRQQKIQVLQPFEEKVKIYAPSDPDCLRVTVFHLVIHWNFY